MPKSHTAVGSASESLPHPVIQSFKNLKELQVSSGSRGCARDTQGEAELCGFRARAIFLPEPSLHGPNVNLLLPTLNSTGSTLMTPLDRIPPQRLRGPK